MYAFKDDLGFGKTEYPDFVTRPVERGPFVVSVTERGELDSSSNVTLKNTVEGSTTIISIVPEGTVVTEPIKSEAAGVVEEVGGESESEQVVTIRADDGVTRDYPVVLGEFTRVLVSKGDEVKAGQILAGDVVCELDSSSLVTQEQTQQIIVNQAIADKRKTDENIAIQIKQNESDVGAAQLLLDVAKLTLKSFQEGERSQLENEQRGAVLLAQEALNQADAVYEFYKRNAKKGFSNQEDLENKRIAMIKAKNDLDVAKEKLKVLTQFTHVKDLLEKGENVKQYELEVERVKLQGKSALTQWEAELKSRELTLKVEQQTLEKLERQIAACTLVAPAKGEVIYASQSSRRSEPVVIEEGVTVRERQDIIKLPDLTQMQVEAGIHESKISNVRVGLPVLVRLDSNANDVFHATVHSVASIAAPGNWPNTDIKEYPVEVRLDPSELEGKDLRPGLTAGIEVIVERRDNVLQAPVQSIITVGEKHFAFVLTSNGPDRREVLIGPSNDQTLEILDGVSEGELMIMNPRTNFSDDIADLEAASEPVQNEAEEGETVKAAPGPAVGNSPEGPPKTVGPGAARTQAGGQGSPAGGAGGDRAASFTRLDKNSDGKLTADELPGQMSKMVDRADANKDGALDKAEFLKAAANRPLGAGGGEPGGGQGAGGPEARGNRQGGGR